MELLVVVAIVGILAAIAVPAYNNYVVRGKIPQATSTLANKRVQMEQYFQDNRSYLLNGACPTTVAPDTTSSQYFSFSCAATATTFTITATGTGDMAGFSYTIDQNNAKTSTITASGWAATSTSCWITKQGGVC